MLKMIRSVGNNLESFATICQKCQLLLICKLIHVVNILMAKERTDWKEFGSIFSLLAYHQINGRTCVEEEYYESFLDNGYHCCGIDQLYEVTMKLIKVVCSELKVEQNKFLICIVWF